MLLYSICYAVWGDAIVDVSIYAYYYNSIVLDSNGNPHIAYYDNNGRNLKYANWNNANWSTQIIDSMWVGKYNSIDIDSNDFPHIAYYDATNKDLKYAKWTGSSWSIEVVDSEGDVGQETTLKLDSNDNPHIVYYDKTNYDLKYASCSGTSWTKYAIESEGTVGVSSDLAIDNSDKPHIAYCYYYYDDHLKYATWDGVSWSTETVNDLVYDNSMEPSICVDSTNKPIISYKDSHLNVAKWTGTSWSTETVDSEKYTGIFNSIAVDSNDHIHISYFKSSILKYAYWSGVSWSTYTINPSCSPHGMSSIDVDNDNSPHVSYMAHYRQEYARITNSPSLSWTGEENYVSDGINPEEGDTSTEFVYRIKYVDIDNEPPFSGYPKVVIRHSGVFVEEVPMNYISGDYNTGAIYSASTSIPDPNVNMNYCFQAYDIWNASASNFMNGSGPELKGYICGHVYDLNKSAISGVTIDMTGSDSKTCTTDSSGYYEFKDLPAGSSYTVTPSCENYQFYPSSRVFNNLNSDFSNQDFNQIERYICGYIYDQNMSAMSGVTIDMTGSDSKTYITDSSGYYEFKDLSAGGEYIITPSYENYQFYPSNRVFSSLVYCFTDQSFVHFVKNKSSHVNNNWFTKIVSSEGSVGYFNSIDIDSEGYPCIAYCNQSDLTLNYAKYNGTSWDKNSIDSFNKYFGHIEMAIDSNDVPHIVNYVERKTIKYLTYKSDSWSINEIDTTSNQSSKHYALSIDIDSNNNPHIAYCQDSQLRYAKLEGSKKTLEVIDNISASSDKDVDIAVDSNNNPHVVYYTKGINILKYAKWTGLVWSTSVIDTSSSLYWEVSICIDSNNMPHVVYYDNTNHDLRYARYTGVGWICETVDSQGDVGQWASLALDSNNNPHIAYADYTHDDLKYAGYNGNEWVIQTIDAGRDVGSYSSIGIDCYDKIHIAYCDWGNRDLKYASWRNHPVLSWTGEINYENDGLNQEVGYNYSMFVFRVKYINEYNDAPKVGYPCLHILKNNSDITGSPFVMETVDNDGTEYNNGKIYSFCTALSVGSDYSYYFKAYDIYNSTAIGDPCDITKGPVVSSLNIPAAGQIKVVGPSKRRGIINPDDGDSAQIYFQGCRVGNYTCRIFSLNGEILYEVTKYSVNSGYFEWIPKNIASGIYIAHVEGPGIDAKKKIAILR